MDFLQIEGIKKLTGNIEISGAKNAALPILASSILSKKEVNFSNIPEVADIKTLLKLLKNLGADTALKNNIATINAAKIDKATANYDIVKTMRASVLALGPLTARFGYAEVSLPGGCAIGQRPIDLHLRALEQMGANISIRQGYVITSARGGLRGANIVFDKITVTGTENIVMAASLAKGKTKIINAAKEPEVIQLCELLRNSGVDILGIGTDEITVYGTDGELLELNDITTIPDRIEAGTYLCAGAITNSKITLKGVVHEHIEAIVAKLSQMGFGFETTKDSITILPAQKIKPIEIATTEFPGFPTDMQAQFVALATQANGVSVIQERLFENRFMHVSELQRMGAKIILRGNSVTIEGQTPLSGADVMATDLRASSALVLAGLVADGITNVHRIYHLDRGYEKLDQKLTLLGAKLKRLKE